MSLTDIDIVRKGQAHFGELWTLVRVGADTLSRKADGTLDGELANARIISVFRPLVESLPAAPVAPDNHLERVLIDLLPSAELSEEDFVKVYGKSRLECAQAQFQRRWNTFNPTVQTLARALGEILHGMLRNGRWLDLTDIEKDYICLKAATLIQLINPQLC